VLIPEAAILARTSWARLAFSNSCVYRSGDARLGVACLSLHLHDVESGGDQGLMCVCLRSCQLTGGMPSRLSPGLITALRSA
jgi:hypothetical protein